MFAKLKKKVLEEGETGAPERLPFSPRKLPGGAVAVRSPPGVGTPASFGEGGWGESVRGEKGGEGEGEKAEKVKTEQMKPLPPQTIDLHPTSLPSHLQSSLTQETVHHELLNRLTQQQQEVVVLRRQLEEVGREWEVEREKWREEAAARLADKDKDLHALQNRFDKVDGEATELKLQVVELQLEKADCEQRLEGEVAGLKESLVEAEREKEEGQKAWSQTRDELEHRIVELEEALSDKEFQVETLEYQVKTLETAKKETLSNLVEVSQDEVLLKLQNEIIDLERRLQSKTMDMEMARIDAENQLRWKEEQLQEGVTRQVNLMATEKELKGKVEEKEEELRELYKTLERERMEGGRREREVERLTGELDKATKTVEQLERQMEEAESSHTRHLEEMASQRDTRVSELSKALEELRGEILGSETVVTPERNPLDFATVATQTDDLPAMLKRGDSVPAVLEVDANFPDTSMNGVGGSEEEEREGEGERDVTMQSHEIIEELQLLRQEKLRLQDEVTEKNKLVRFQQLKIVDMRKALNKELRSQTSQDMVTSLPPTSHSHPFTSPPIAPWQGGISPTLPPGGQITSFTDVNVQYLKHVIIKFLCSREDEATQLIRAVSTLLDFTTQEEQFVKDYFDYKMSWFGSMPRPIYHPVRKMNAVRHS